MRPLNFLLAGMLAAATGCVTRERVIIVERPHGKVQAAPKEALTPEEEEAIDAAQPPPAPAVTLTEVHTVAGARSL
jgi:hypothetical protein